MKKTLSIAFGLAAVAAAFLGRTPEVQAQDKAAAKPLKALLVLGGCCHDYNTQKDLLKAGLEERLNIQVDVEYSPDKTTKAVFPVYKKADWAAGYDVVIHDECSADVTDAGYIKSILDAHANGLPAVNIHCAMHSYRSGNFREKVAPGADNAGWFEMLGLQSTGHGPQEPISVTFDGNSGIAKGLSGWTTGKEELYNNVAILTGKTVAKGSQVTKDKQGNEKTTETVVAWTNEYGPKKTRIFSTTLGHNNETVQDDRYLDFLARGVLWATGKLGDDGKTAAGYEAK
jgi:type 1 glutamine amidotransferase